MSARPTAPRNAVACVPCRTAKLRCSHHNQAPCDRCRSAGRAASCYFPQKWTSALHRQPKKPRRGIQRQVEQPRRSEHGRPNASASFIAADDQSFRLNPTEDLRAFSRGEHPSDDPLRWFTNDVQQCYLRCTYKWSFHHKPRLLQQIRDGTLDMAMAWAILTLASRYSPTPGCFGSPLEASNFFSQRASRAVQLRITSPSLPQVQALLLLTGHKWGAGDGKSAWIYLGIAVRMVQMLGLCAETSNASSSDSSASASEAFILAEERRRTAWTCFLMESLLSGGGSRARILRSEDMTIQLPCEDEAFVFGTPVRCELFNDAYKYSSEERSDTRTSPSILAYTVRVADIWGHVARWASCGDDNPAAQSPGKSDRESRAYSLVSSLEHWKATLPARLRYSLFSLQAHSVLEQGQGFCYMHCIYFMALIFLHRHHLPHLGLARSPAPPSPVPPPRNSPDQEAAALPDRADQSSHTLYDTASTVCDMCDEINRAGADFRRGLVPWIGFTVYTTIGVMLYFQSFPLEPSVEFLTRTRQKLHSAYLLLREMKNEWPMASRWLENIYSLQKYHATRLQKTSLSAEELQSFRNLMVDYGALHDTVVSDTTGGARSTGNTSDMAMAIASGPGPESDIWSSFEARPPHYAPLRQQQGTPQSARTESASASSGVDALTVPDEFDGADYLVSEEEMAGIFQEFWTMFPGEINTDHTALE
ncbi:putative transcriptional regulatory protein PB1A11.04c [Fonsecaea pedrosoi]|nr:putative transcriptional regulatory protein PB1A11.04c [Fonsecaea pedrosoi]